MLHGLLCHPLATTFPVGQALMTEVKRIGEVGLQEMSKEQLCGPFSPSLPWHSDIKRDTFFCIPASALKAHSLGGRGYDMVPPKRKAAQICSHLLRIHYRQAHPNFLSFNPCHKSMREVMPGCTADQWP
uniref:Uncharacterized protein n=1 Tax=Rousettus aegyptiacus TaxID=9407 RepID=A0A7J8DI21_ROUAE|nr:hypothetical protein HJG63_008571 [Rousettus aegyptiacus]